MTELQLALLDRFGEGKVTLLPTNEGDLSLIYLDLDTKNQVKVLMTNGLSDYRMPVPDKLKGREFNELYFCLPNYWELDDHTNPQMNWVFPGIQRLAKFVRENETWFGPGHTMQCGSERESLSSTMRQNHFFLSDPILLEQELKPLMVGEKEVYFLSIIPIFPDEMDYKQGKGTFKFLQKLINHGISEKLDDYRSTVLRSKWRLRSK